MASILACSSSNNSSAAPPQNDGGTESSTTGPSLYTPAGYSLVSFLSETPKHEFTSAEEVLEAGTDYVAVLETDAGRIVLDLYEEDTPVTVNSFVFLALHHFYDGIAFHRVIDGFMAQTGDPNSIDGPASSWGTGGAGYTFDLEVKSDLTFEGAGVLGMARSKSPSSNGSQFFITLATASHLDQNYTVFGKVTEGLDVLPSIVRGEPPKTPTRITTAHVVSKKK